MRIGLFGGTFDPPHDAHLAACLIAMKRLKLDRVWWLVTPGNPLKDTRGLAPLDERIMAARALARHPRIEVLGLEARIGRQDAGNEEAAGMGLPARAKIAPVLNCIARCPRSARSRKNDAMTCETGHFGTATS